MGLAESGAKSPSEWHAAEKVRLTPTTQLRAGQRRRTRTNTHSPAATSMASPGTPGASIGAAVDVKDEPREGAVAGLTVVSAANWVGGAARDAASGRCRDTGVDSEASKPRALGAAME